MSPKSSTHKVTLPSFLIFISFLLAQIPIVESRLPSFYWSGQNDDLLINMLDKRVIKWEGGSGWGIHVTPWLIHVNVWQNPLKCCEVISLQLIKINEKKKKFFLKSNKGWNMLISPKCPSIFKSVQMDFIFLSGVGVYGN